MSTATTRVFDDQPAKREKTPLLVGLIGPSGSGKTYSALRIATGIQRVVGGEIYGIDTEARRMLHYADKFKFRHVPFGAPFSPLDYLAAIEHCVKKGASVVIVDSMSHEHEGPGGVLDWHRVIVERKSKGDDAKAERIKLGCWAEPKAARRRMINGILQMPVHFIFCFRAKEKIRPVPGREPEHLGFLPIAGEEFVYEMTLKCLLLPGANGVPTWQSEFTGEKMMIKLPEQFRSTFAAGNLQLTEDLAGQLAAWAEGSAITNGNSNGPTVANLIDRYAACSDAATLRTLEATRSTLWARASKDEKSRLKTAADSASERVRAADESPHDPDTGEVPDDQIPPHVGTNGN